MKFNIYSIYFNADNKLLDFVNRKVCKLSIYDDKMISGDVYLRLDKADSHSNKIVEIKINNPGSDMFAKKQSSSFEEATDLAVDAIRKQIKKYKGKKRNK